MRTFQVAINHAAIYSTFLGISKGHLRLTPRLDHRKIKDRPTAWLLAQLQFLRLTLMFVSPTTNLLGDLKRYLRS